MKLKKLIKQVILLIDDEEAKKETKKDSLKNLLKKLNKRKNKIKKSQKKGNMKERDEELKILKINIKKGKKLLYKLYK